MRATICFAILLLLFAAGCAQPQPQTQPQRGSEPVTDTTTQAALAAPALPMSHWHKRCLQGEWERSGTLVRVLSKQVVSGDRVKYVYDKHDLDDPGNIQYFDAVRDGDKLRFVGSTARGTLAPQPDGSVRMYKTVHSGEYVGHTDEASLSACPSQVAERDSFFAGV